MFQEMLGTVLQNSYFSFENKKFYKQITDTAMGMCVSVFFANAYMYHVTRRLIKNPPTEIVTFLRYIDNSYLSWMKKLPRHEEIFKGISKPTIKYTIKN